MRTRVMPGPRRRPGRSRVCTSSSRTASTAAGGAQHLVDLLHRDRLVGVPDARGGVDDEETAAYRSPASAARVTSGTPVIPATSAPASRARRISARVSNRGPSKQA